jgi:hypothetical protein
MNTVPDSSAIALPQSGSKQGKQCTKSLALLMAVFGLPLDAAVPYLQIALYALTMTARFEQQ